MANGLVLSALIALAAVGAGYLVYNQREEGLAGPIKVRTESKAIEEHLQRFKDALGPDYVAYRNHCLRVLNYAMHYLKQDQTYAKELAAALVYHDIGLWSDSILDYLEPSVARAKADLSELGFSNDQIELISDMIRWHHKVTPYVNATKSTGYVAAVEAFRKADWIDAMMGLVSQGMPREHIAKVQRAVPNEGFHKALMNFGFKLHQWNVPRHLEIFRIFKW